MIPIDIRQRSGPADRYRLLVEAVTEPSRPVTLPPAAVSESDQFSVRVFVSGYAAVRVFVGSVLVASSLGSDRVLLMDHDDTQEADPPLICRGRLFADWVGLTELVVQMRPEDSSIWHRLLTLPVAISAGKMATE